MPRGVRKTPLQTVETDIALLDEKIKKAAEQLKALKTQRSDLLKRKREMELSLLHDAITESGKSVEDVIHMIAQTQ